MLLNYANSCILLLISNKYLLLQTIIFSVVYDYDRTVGKQIVITIVVNVQYASLLNIYDSTFNNNNNGDENNNKNYASNIYYY